MKFPFHSLRWRLQIWYAVILLVTIFAFCFTAYQLSWLNQTRRIDRSLVEEEREVIRAFSKEEPSRQKRDPEGEDRSISPAEFFLLELEEGSVQIPPGLDGSFDSRNDGFQYFAFADAEGRILLASPEAPENIRFLPVPENGMGEDFQFDGNRRESRRSFSFGLRTVFGKDITPELRDQQTFAWSLVLSGGALWFVGLLGGWWLAGRAIRPIQSISRTATRIASGHLDERINVSGREDELHQLSRVLNQTFDELQNSVERQRQFTADASHELRTPLTILISETQRMCKKTRSVEEYAESMAVCRDAGQRMRKLVESLLLLARQEDQVVKFGAEAGEKVDFAEVAEQAVREIRPLAEERGVRCLTSLSPASVVGSRDALGVLVNNLISNAVLHHPGQGQVEVRVEETEGEVILIVADDGTGIAAEDLPHIFERFYRADKSRTDSGEHSGLGLALAQSIAKNHCGSISVESRVGEGAVFTVRLPSWGAECSSKSS